MRYGGGSVRWKGDLYQLGLGPKATVHCTEWLDAYAGCEMLVGISHSSLDTPSGRGSDTDARLGCGGYLGLAGWYECVGVFAQVGYDYLDDSSISAGGYRAKTDFSGLNLSVGLAVRF